MKNFVYYFGLFLVNFLLSSCSSKLSDSIKKVTDFFSLTKESTLILISNSTTNQNSCTHANSVTIEKNFPKGAAIYCRDLSTLSAGIKKGAVCPGGVSISDVSVSSQTTDCSQPTLCGVAASSIQLVGTRNDGGAIQQLKFDNLPWGCAVNFQISFDPLFSKDATSQLKFAIQPPDCPFCVSQNQNTCLACRDLSSNEEVLAGQVVFKNCSGGSCQSCSVIGNPTEKVEHGKSKLYFRGINTSSCAVKCNSLGESLVRVCNNGFWEGDTSFQSPQCFDLPCGCKLKSTDTTSYTHGTTITAFPTREPACGIDCSPTSLSCSDGNWYSGNTLLSSQAVAQLPETTCAKKVCACNRGNRQPVGDGASATVYSQATYGCTENKQIYSGTVTCNSGTLTASDAKFLNYAFDNITQEDCGCAVNASDRSFLLANSRSTTLYQYNKNTEEVPDACTNSAYRKSISCTNKVLSTYDSSIFKYSACTTTPLSCTFTDGNNNKVVVASGASLIVSKNSTPACGEACDNLNLICQNKIFKKKTTLEVVSAETLAQYKSSSQCAVRNCDCNVNGNILPFGTSGSFYKTDRVTNCNINGCRDANTTINCTKDGPVSSKGDDPFLYQSKSCQVIPCQCTVPWGGSIESGKTIKIFSIQSSTNCSNTNTSECDNPNNFSLVTCNNGSLSNYNQNTFQYPFCSPPVCFCQFKSVKTPISQTLKVYKSAHPSSGQTCNSISAVFSCGNGGLWNSNGIGESISDYSETNCSQPTDSGNGGGTGGGTGNSEGPGFGIKQRLGLIDMPHNPPCFNFQSCRVNEITTQFSRTPRLPCLLPWGGGEVQVYSSLSMFNAQCVLIGQDSCESHRAVRTCHISSWSGDSSYRFPECQEKSSCP